LVVTNANFNLAAINENIVSRSQFALLENTTPKLSFENVYAFMKHDR